MMLPAAPFGLVRRSAPVLAMVAVLSSACGLLTDRDASERARQRRTEALAFTAALMPEEARGARLGMDWVELQRARPGIEHGVENTQHGIPFHYLWEMSDSHSVSYFFSDSTRPDSAFMRPLAKGVLSIVEISPDRIHRSDTAAYRRVVASILAQWNSVVGPADSAVRCWLPQPDGSESEPREWRTWRRPEVTLLLATTPDDQLTTEPARAHDGFRLSPADHSRGVIMIIQNALLPIDAGFLGGLRTTARCR